MRWQSTVEVAEIVFGLFGDCATEALSLDQIYSDFLCSGEPDVVLKACYNGLPPIPLRDEDRIFDSQMVWSLYRVDGRTVFALRSPVFGPQPYRIAVFDEDFRHGEVYNALPETPESRLCNPLEYPLSEVLMVCLLARGRGLHVHACGIEDNGRGYLFAGNSTHGKTTMARLWQGEGRILNDDRIVLRARDGRIWMYGTPWHGECDSVSPDGVPLEHIFFLRHAEADGLSRVTGTRAAAMLLARSFPPLWDADGMAFTLDFCDRVVGAVTCGELGFVPDRRGVDFIRCRR